MIRVTASAFVNSSLRPFNSFARSTPAGRITSPATYTPAGAAAVARTASSRFAPSRSSFLHSSTAPAPAPTTRSVDHRFDLPSSSSTFVARPRGSTATIHPSDTPQRRLHATMTVSSSASPLPDPVVAAPAPASVAGRNPVFAQVMLRIASPAASHAFYAGQLGMRQLTRFDFPAFKFSLFFYAYSAAAAPDVAAVPQSERAQWLWARPEPTVELTWNWPRDTLDDSLAADAAAHEAGAKTEEEEEVYVSGNETPKGFRCLRVNVNDAAAAAAALRNGGVTVLAETATMATVADPEGYHVELVSRPAPTGSPTAAALVSGGALGALDPVFAGAVLRIRDARAGIPFFQKLGFSLLGRSDDDATRTTEFSLAYLSSAGEAAAAAAVRAPVLTLVQEWGVENKASDEEPLYTNGNVKPNRGYGHVGIVVDDIYETTKKMESDGAKVVRQPAPFADVGDISFVAEPSTDYWVEIITRAGEPADAPYEQPA